MLVQQSDTKIGARKAAWNGSLTLAKDGFGGGIASITIAYP